MAGAGYKLFATGDVLTAAQVNTYLNEQTVMVFADSAARTTALSGVLAEGMMSYLQDTDSVEVYDGSAWTAIGGGGLTSPLTTKGDVWGYSTTNARIPIGANGTVLTADSAETLGVKWAAAGAGGSTLITTATFSNVADTGTTFDGVFTSTYDNYEIQYSCYGATGTADFHFQLRYAGPTTQTTTYLWQKDGIEGATPTSTWSRNISDTEWELSDYLGTAPYSQKGVINIMDVLPSHRPAFLHHGFNPLYEYGVFGQGYQATARTYTGFLLKASTGNIYGTVSVYGLAK